MSRRVPLRSARAKTRATFTATDAAVSGKLGWYTLKPLSERAKSWLSAHINAQPWERPRVRLDFDYGPAFEIIVDAMRGAGLVIRRLRAGAL